MSPAPGYGVTATSQQNNGLLGKPGTVGVGSKSPLGNPQLSAAAPQSLFNNAVHGGQPQVANMIKLLAGGED